MEKEKKQDSQGNLKNNLLSIPYHPAAQIEYTTPSRSTEKQTYESRFKTVNVPITLIRSIVSIPDFTTPTMLSQPRLVYVKGDYYCEDGGNFVADAQARGEKQIECQVEYCEFQSPVELALRKVASRLRTPSGQASYAENVRAIVSLGNLLQEHGYNTNSHGGSRRDDKDRSKDIAQTIATEMNLGRESVVNYINYGSNLSEEVFQTLAEGRASKRFFEKIQHHRQFKMRNLLAHEKTAEEIKLEISKNVLDAWKKWDGNKTDKKSLIKAFQIEKVTPDMEPENDPQSLEQLIQIDPVVNLPTSLNDGHQLPLSKDEFNKKMIKIGQEAIQIANEPEPFNLDVKKRLEDEVKSLNTIFRDYCRECERQTQKNGGEV
jgi:hypothetical protein